MERIARAAPVTIEQTLQADFPDLSEEKVKDICDLLAGKVVGRNIYHTWYNEQENKDELYHGKIEQLLLGQGARGSRAMTRKTRARKARKSVDVVKKYNIAYWGETEKYENATDTEVTVVSLATDLLLDYLVLL